MNHIEQRVCVRVCVRVCAADTGRPTFIEHGNQGIDGAAVKIDPRSVRGYGCVHSGRVRAASLR